MEASPISHPPAPAIATHTEGYADILIMTSHTSFRCLGSSSDLLYAIVIFASANEGATLTA